MAGQERYTEEDVAASRAGLRLLEWGIPLTDLLDLARRHNEATEATARQAVEMFARHVREPLRAGVRPDALSDPDHGLRRAGRRTGDPAVDGLLQAYAELLPAVNTLVGHHFSRTLVGWPSTMSSRKAPTRNVGRYGTGSTPPGATPVPWKPLRSSPPMTGADGAVASGPARPPRSAAISLETAARAREADLPTGADEDGAGAVDVRRHRPPLRPGQPDHDLRPRHPVAQAVPAGAGPPGRHHRPRPGLRHR